MLNSNILFPVIVYLLSLLLLLFIYLFIFLMHVGQVKVKKAFTDSTVAIFEDCSIEDDVLFVFIII